MNIGTAITQYQSLLKLYPRLILGGSAALILQSRIINRDVTDLDLVCAVDIDFTGIEVESKPSADESKSVLVQGIAFDFFHQPDVVANAINFKGVTVMCQDPKHIIEAKLRYLHRGQIKHRDDIIQYLTTIQ